MKDVIRRVAPFVLLLAVGWLALLVAAPLLPAAPAALIYAFGSLICHQIPERSLYLGSIQLPVCARCLGIYAGVAVGCGAGLVSPAIVAEARSTRRVRIALLAGAMPTMITVIAEWLGVWHTSNVTRAVAGAALGVAIGAVVIGALATLHYDECAPSPPIVADRPPRHI